jgi:[ribosomal protein S18]-alanine N-acetyltransferase
MRMRLLAQTRDAALLARLHAECFAEPWSAESFAALLEQPATFALITNDGFILVRVAGDESEVLTLAVRPAARRRGIASAVLIEAAKQAEEQGAKAMFLEVGASNSPAIALYKRFGFAQVGCRGAYYAVPGGGSEDALVLRVEIPLARVGNRMQLG